MVQFQECLGTVRYIMTLTSSPDSNPPDTYPDEVHSQTDQASEIVLASVQTSKLRLVCRCVVEANLSDRSFQADSLSSQFLLKLEGKDSVETKQSQSVAFLILICLQPKTLNGLCLPLSLFLEFRHQRFYSLKSSAQCLFNVAVTEIGHS